MPRVGLHPIEIVRLALINSQTTHTQYLQYLDASDKLSVDYYIVLVAECLKLRPTSNVNGLNGGYGGFNLSPRTIRAVLGF